MCIRDRLILVDGTLSSSLWKDKNGESQIQLSITAESIAFINTGKRDVYKRQAQECCVRNTDNASFLQFHDRNSIRHKKDSDITGIVLSLIHI